MLINSVLVYILFFCGLIRFSLNRKHFLVILLRLEFLVISLYLLLRLNFCLLRNEYFFLIIFLTMRVCEGALGLRILVSLIRSFGNDYIINITILW